MLHKKIIVNKKDKYRAILTDALPYEVPIIFSNKTFYECLKGQSKTPRMQKVVDAIINLKSYNRSHIIPYRFDITKGAYDTRELCLLHPYSQKALADFYEDYSDLITYYCSLSKISIRSPIELTSSFYVHNFDEDKNKFKSDTVLIEDTDLYSKYVTSFFCYSGYEKIYKFYNSAEMQLHEKRFSHMMSVDITNCFGSIYTHSIAWAVKDKLFVKENIDQKNSFAQKFDKFFQKSNHEETNGIPIGPEVSRIFAEVILQRIDINLIDSLLEKCNLNFGQHYIIRRYVDDYFVFANDEKNLDLILEALKKELRFYRFIVNDKKVHKTLRPFYTNKSKAISEIKDLFNDFFDELFATSGDGENSYFISKSIKKRKVVHRYIERIKLICHSSQIGYDGIANFSIGLIFKRVNQIFRKLDKKNLPTEYLATEEFCTKNALAIIEIVFFLYSTAPSVTSSYNLAKTIIIIQRFFQDIFPSESEAINQSIYDHIISFLSIMHSKSEENHFKKVQLESINLLLILADLGEAKLLPEGFLQEVFSSVAQGQLRYFETISLLYYIGKYPDYNQIRKILNEKIQDRFVNNDFNVGCSETLHMILDIIACPYLAKNIRKEISIKLLAQFGLRNDQPEAQGFVNDSEIQGWFVSWKNVDLLNVLERKVLQNPYD